MKLRRWMRTWTWCRNGDLEDARCERRVSERDLEKAKREVIEPLKELAARNHYAQIIAHQIRRNAG